MMGWLYYLRHYFKTIDIDTKNNTIMTLWINLFGKWSEKENVVGGMRRGARSKPRRSGTRLRAVVAPSFMLSSKAVK